MVIWYFLFENYFLVTSIHLQYLIIIHRYSFPRKNMPCDNENGSARRTSSHHQILDRTCRSIIFVLCTSVGHHRRHLAAWRGFNGRVLTTDGSHFTILHASCVEPACSLVKQGINTKAVSRLLGPPPPQIRP